MRNPFWLLLHPFLSLPFRVALPLRIPARLFAPWSLTVGVVLLPLLVVLHWLFTYGRSLLLEVTHSPFLCLQLGLLPLLCLLKGRRVLGRPFRRRRAF